MLRSERVVMKARHHKELQQLMETCKHKNLIIKRDSSNVGCGSSSPRIDIICRNCGRKKCMFKSREEVRTRVRIEKRLDRQPGIKDQRLNIEVRWQHELEPD